MTMGATDMAAQSFLKKFGDAVKNEIKKEVKKEVNNAADKAAERVVDGIRNIGNTRQESDQSSRQTAEKQTAEKQTTERQTTERQKRGSQATYYQPEEEEQSVDIVRRPYREEKIPHAPQKWAPHTAQGQKQAEEARIAKFEFIKEVDLYFADGSTKGTHKVFNDGEGLCVEIKEKHYKITPCNEEFFGVPHYGQCTYMGMDLYIREHLSGLDATARVPTATEKAICGTLNGHDWVDLGLPSGTKWATCNIGATSPEKPGNLYAWGESTTKSEYSDINYSLHGQFLRAISGRPLLSQIVPQQSASILSGKITS